MRIDRRQLGKQVAIVTAGICLFGCGSSPTAPESVVPLPASQPRAVLVAATGVYTYMIKANESFGSVAEAAGYVNLNLDIRDKTNWLTAQGNSFAGGFVRGINGISGNWLINFGDRQFCSDVRNQSVPKGTLIGFFLDDGKHYTSC